MCESNVYLSRGGQEELLMESVDRIIPAEDGNIFLESIFGERKIIKARIREMELVHHRIILEEIQNSVVAERFYLHASRKITNNVIIKQILLLASRKTYKCY